jgi:hypothetical protein
MFTKHAEIRAQQRRIPPLIDSWLSDFGEEEYDGHGAVIRYFSRRSIRNLEWAFGCEPVRCLARYLNAYKVENSRNGRVITVGHRTKTIKRG